MSELLIVAGKLFETRMNIAHTDGVWTSLKCYMITYTRAPSRLEKMRNFPGIWSKFESKMLIFYKFSEIFGRKRPKYPSKLQIFPPKAKFPGNEIPKFRIFPYMGPVPLSVNHAATRQWWYCAQTFIEILHGYSVNVMHPRCYLQVYYVEAKSEQGTARLLQSYFVVAILVIGWALWKHSVAIHKSLYFSSSAYKSKQFVQPSLVP